MFRVARIRHDGRIVYARGPFGLCEIYSEGFTLEKAIKTVSCPRVHRRLENVSIYSVVQWVSFAHVSFAFQKFMEACMYEDIVSSIDTHFLV